MYDTAGIERHMSTIPQTYFRWSKVIMLVYSIEDSDTFDSLTNWSDNAISARTSGSGTEVFTVLVGNKLDLDEDRRVSKARALQFAENNEIEPEMVFEISAMEGTGVEEMIEAVALKIQPSSSKGGGKVQQNSGKKGKCC